MIITISGTAASNKSKVAKELVKKLGFDLFSINKNFVKKLASKRGMDVKDYYKKHADKIDFYLDKWQQDLCKFMDGFILESKIGFHWARNSPVKTFNIFLEYDNNTITDKPNSNNHASSGTYQEDKLSQEDKFEIENYRKRYNIENFHDSRHFDFVMNTSNMSVNKVCRVLLEKMDPLLIDENKKFDALVKKFPKLSNQKKHIYVSTPHTTGKTYYDTLCMVRHMNSRIFKKVISENEKSANDFFKTVSSHYNTYAINPVDVGYFVNIQQREGLALWRRFIRKYISRVFMNDGWQYSNGCVEEFYLALKEGVDVYGHDFRPLDKKKGLGMIESAIMKIKGLGMECDKLEFFHREINMDTLALLNTAE